MANQGNRSGFSTPEQHFSSQRATGLHERSTSTVESLKDKASDIASGASNLASDAKEKVEQFASDVASKAGDAWDSTRQMASSIGSNLGNAFDNVGAFVRRHPVPSLLCALGVGFMMAETMQCMIDWSNNRRRI